MTALIFKDIAILKKPLLLTIVISIVLVFYGIYENLIFMVPLIFVMIPLILTAITFGYDTKSNFEQFAFSMPIKKSSYVLSKLFFAIAFGLVASVCIFILLIIKGHISFYNIVLIALIILVFDILISSIQLPFILKYGAENGRLIMVITYFLIFALLTLLKEKLDFIEKLIEIFSKNSLSIICLVILVVSLIIIGIAIKASIIIMDKKEY